MCRKNVIKEYVCKVIWRVRYGRGRRLNDNQDMRRQLIMHDRANLDECVFVDMMNGMSEIGVQVKSTNIDEYIDECVFENVGERYCDSGVQVITENLGSVL